MAHIAYDKINCCDDSDVSFSVRNFNWISTLLSSLQVITISIPVNSTVTAGGASPSNCDLWTLSIWLDTSIHGKKTLNWIESNLNWLQFVVHFVQWFPIFQMGAAASTYLTVLLSFGPQPDTGRNQTWPSNNNTNWMTSLGFYLQHIWWILSKKTIYLFASYFPLQRVKLI